MRDFLVSFFIHVLVISFVWVGFSVSQGHEQNSFAYLGELMAGVERYAQSGQPSKPSDTMMLEESSPAYFAPWLRMRELNKPH